jgi:hypothetical protein
MLNLLNNTAYAVVASGKEPALAALFAVRDPEED